MSLVSSVVTSCLRPYIELHTASAFSFLQGASLPESIVERAADLGYPAVALLDRDGVYGAPRFHKAATAAGLRPIIGAELTIAEQEGTENGQKTERPVFRLQTVPPSQLPVAARPLRKPGGLSKSLPADHPDEDARAERRRRADAGGSGRLAPAASSRSPAARRSTAAAAASAA